MLVLIFNMIQNIKPALLTTVEIVSAFNNKNVFTGFVLILIFSWVFLTYMN